MVRLPQLPALLCALALAPFTAAQGKTTPQDWPFGVDAKADASAMLQKRDLFNLGPLGAKAWDADRQEPAKERQSGTRRIEGSGERAPDTGPKRLLVRALFGGGPAQRAGLVLGDVITGVNGQPFAEGSLGPLAAAITAAESGDGKLSLTVERKGNAETLVLKLPAKGKPAAAPETGKMRQDLLDQACQWLAEHQEGGGFPETLGGKTGAVVMTCLSGLAWLGDGTTQKRGKWKANVKSAAQFVLRGMGEKSPMGPEWDQSTWGYAHAAIFLGELQLAEKSHEFDKDLQRIVDTLCQRQEVSGGYGHGAGGKNALGYIELNILAGYVCSALSLAQQAGAKVDGKVVDKLLGYCRDSASDDGGVGYSTMQGQKGMGNIGRTVGTWLGARGLGRGGEVFPQLMEHYVRANVGKVLDGHASLQQHILLAGLAAGTLGGDAAAAYWDSGMRRDLVLARAPDGSFQPRPWHESLSMESNTDVSMGEVWSTASWAIVLAAQGGTALPGWCGTRK